MSTYYQYKDVKVLIAHRLLQKGWKVYGYSPDNSDMMVDYYDPAYWGGIAEKNGYKLVVDCSSEAKGRYEKSNVIRKRVYILHRKVGRFS